MMTEATRKRMRTIADAYQRVSKAKFPSVRYLPDPDVGDMDGGVIAAFMVPAEQRSAFREFMLTELADAVEGEGEEYLGAIIYTEEQTKASYPALYETWKHEKRTTVIFREFMLAEHADAVEGEGAECFEVIICTEEQTKTPYTALHEIWEREMWAGTAIPRKQFTNVFLDHENTADEQVGEKGVAA